MRRLDERARELIGEKEDLFRRKVGDDNGETILFDPLSFSIER